MTIEKIINDLIGREGEYVDHPADHGGPTKYGITLATLREVRNDDTLTAKDVRALTTADAYDIYYSKYILKPRINHLADKKLQVLVFDFSVHSGSGRAIRYLQRLLGIIETGYMRELTLKAANAFTTSSSAHPQELRKKYLEAREGYLKRIVAKDPSQEVFADGWQNRIDGLRKEFV